MSRGKYSKPIEERAAEKGRFNYGNYITLDALYRQYPHRRRVPGAGITAPPYIKDKDVSTHEYALDFREWKVVVKCYFKYLLRYLIKGYTYKIPWGCGLLTLVKVRRARRDQALNQKRYKETGQKGYIKGYDYNLDGYSLLLNWNRSLKTGAQFPFKSYYKVEIIENVFRGIVKAMRLDRSMLYRLQNAKGDE